MQKSAQHSSHWYQDVQRMLPRINRNSLGWRLYRAPHLPSGSVQIFPGWDAVALERSQGMATCQWEGFWKEEDVGIYCRRDFPSCLVETSLHWFPPKLARAIPAHCAPWEVCTVLPVVITLVRSFVDANEVLFRIRHLWKSILKSCYPEATWSKCPAIQKHVPGSQ